MMKRNKFFPALAAAALALGLSAGLLTSGICSTFLTFGNSVIDFQ